jgi:hypothetical protein
MLRGSAGAITLAAIVSLSLITSAGATTPKKSLAKVPQLPASAPALPHPQALGTPRPQPTCGPPINLLWKFMPVIHCPG